MEDKQELSDEYYMRRCFELASLGIGHVAPNPMVGAVIVHNGEIIGEGYHPRFGEPHAEVNAIESVKDKSLLKEATIFVSLEPCAHHGKTPPCSDLIIEAGIPKAVIAVVDPYKEVSGKGIQRMRDAGVDVAVGLLENEARYINRRFFTFHTEKRPYIILKWAETQDGYIDKKRTDNDTGINWITTPAAKRLTHKWRGEEQAILVGRNTVETDNPTLTCRDYLGKNPLRCVIDPHLKTDLASNIYSKEAPTVIFNYKRNDQTDRCEYVKVRKKFVHQDIMKHLCNRNIQSIIVEGGMFTLNSFIDANLWDEARVYIGKKFFKEGIPAPQLKKESTAIHPIGDDALHFLLND